MEGTANYNPGWHLAVDLRHLLICAEAVARAALTRTESRGAHTRSDHPETDEETWGKVNLVIRRVDGGMTVVKEPLVALPEEFAGYVHGDQA